MATSWALSFNWEGVSSSTAPIWPNGIPDQSANGSIRYSPKRWASSLKGKEISLVPDSIN